MESKMIFLEGQREYWLGIGMLFYLMKHSRPEIVYAMLELSEANDSANLAAFKKLLHAKTGNLGGKIEHMGNTIKH